MTYLPSFIEEYVIRHSEAIDLILTRYGESLGVLIVVGIFAMFFAIWKQAICRKPIDDTQPSSPGDPTRFGDAVAERTDWSPLTRGGANFCTHRLSKPTPYVCEVRPTILSIFVYFILFAFGLCFLLAGIQIIFDDLQNFKLPIPIYLFALLLGLSFCLIGLLFSRIGGLMLYYGMNPFRFDKRTGIYSIGRNPKPGKDCIQLAQIHAIQLLAEYNRSPRNASYHSFELNLVLKDATRINVTDHANLKHTLSDSKTLSEFLGVPVWDAIILECDLNSIV